MQEGIVLKKRFDDVFESTRYTKALDALSKTKKEIQSKSKDLKAEVMEYNAHLHATVQSKNELSLCEENQNNCTNDLDRITVELEDHQERVSNISIVVVILVLVIGVVCISYMLLIFILSCKNYLCCYYYIYILVYRYSILFYTILTSILL